MVRLPPYVVIFLVTSLSLLLLGGSDDRLTPGEFISLNETLVSDAGEFVFGFFSPTNSTGDFYAGVWYNNIPQRTVIWVANREKPINDSSATLRISDDSNLVIVDSEGGIFWSSNLSGFGTPGNDTAAVLYNSGNLVLRANSHNILWQSFDHPTDTFVPGMKILYNYRNHSTRYLTSWKDANDPSPGNFSLGIGSSTPAQFLIWSGTKLYRRSQVWIGKMFIGLRAINTTAVVYITMTEDDDEIGITLGVSDASLMLSSGGEDLYLRLMDISLGTSGSKTKARRIVIIVSLSAIIVCLACIFILWKFSEVFGVFKDPKNGKLLCDLSSSTDFANNISGSNEFIEGKPHQGPELPLIGFENILLATNNFSESNKLGKGGFGIVYKGNLPGGKEIAVKRLLRGSRQGMEEFKNEVILIAKLQHRNLVKLLAFCIHGEEKLLVYEYMPNKSLDFLLFDPTQKTELDWGKRFNIIKGIARALLYLHQDSRLRIIHRDLKASNVLLDEEMNPKVSDFGLAKIFGGNQDEANTDRVVGTYGYMSPEYAMEGLFSVKSDVYSYGVLLLEIVSGFRNSSFPLAMDSPNLLAYAWQLWNEGNAEDYVDPSIACSCARAEVVRSIHVGLLCVQDSPSDRPAMSSVVFMLENEEATISAAPKQPIFTIQRNLNPDTGHPPDDTYQVYSYNNVTVTAAEGR
uniref:non-specific serine/threonine protein kinase n=1 Tax=Musa acuminata subsp. malaccensis TaxID=214687 RepID=A0A804K3W1_MUSAM